MCCFGSLTDLDYSRLWTLAFRVGLAHSLNRYQAEDVAQDAVIALWLRVSSDHGQPIQNQSRWVAACARNASLRVMKMQQPLSDPLLMTVPIEEPWNVDLKIDLASALGQLSTGDQRIFRHRFVQHKPLSIIAEQMGCSERTVRRRLKRIRSTLVNMLEMYQNLSV